MAFLLAALALPLGLGSAAGQDATVVVGPSNVATVDVTGQGDVTVTSNVVAPGARESTTVFFDQNGTNSNAGGNVSPGIGAYPAPVVRVAFITTDNCNDPSPGAGVPAGLCRPAPNTNNGAGPNPDFINANVTFIDNGIIMTATGTGQGFRRNMVDALNYATLIYLNPAVQTCARFPPGTAALTTNTLTADNDFASMFIGNWQRDKVTTTGTDLTNATLNVVRPTPIGGLAAYGTASVREQSGVSIGDFVLFPNDIPPQLNGLRACGGLVPGPAVPPVLTVLDPVVSFNSAGSPPVIVTP